MADCAGMVFLEDDRLDTITAICRKGMKARTVTTRAIGRTRKARHEMPAKEQTMSEKQTVEAGNSLPPPLGSAIVPKLAIGYTKNGYAISGWNELNRWAVENDPVWAGLCIELLDKGYSEADSLRLMCAGLLMEKHGQLWPKRQQAPKSNCDRCTRVACNEVYHADGSCMPNTGAERR